MQKNKNIIYYNKIRTYCQLIRDFKKQEILNYAYEDVTTLYYNLKIDPKCDYT